MSFPADMSAHLTNDIITNDKTSTEAITIIPHEVNNATTQQGIDVTYPTITNVHTILQYDWVDNTNYYKSYKKRRFIDVAIHILVAPHMMPQSIQTSHSLPAHTTANIFSDFFDLLFKTSDPCLHALHIVDNKADTLTQSQMLKDTEADKFV